MRPNGGSPEEVVLCNTLNTMCIPSVDGYSATIDSPTQQTLTIASFNPATDVGEWICKDGPYGAGSISCNMAIRGM